MDQIIQDTHVIDVQSCIYSVPHHH